MPRLSVRPYQDGHNNVSYPEFTSGNRTRFSQTFASIARLIRGGLQSKVYVLSGAGGFDTHRNQANSHAQRMEEIGKSVDSFYQDLAQDGLDDRVLTMTFSEFGRTIHENGSKGTDHGAGAPIMLFGSALKGGFEGATPDLSQPFNQGAAPTTDFRSVYRTILEQWFSLDADLAQSLVGGPFPVIDGMIAPAPPIDDPGTGSRIQDIELNLGWNLISTHVRPKNPAMEMVLADVLDDMLLVKDGDGHVFFPEQDIATLDAWQSGAAYQVYMTRPRTLSIEGQPAEVEDTVVPLQEGWNHIATLYDHPVDVVAAFEPLGDALVLVKDADGRVYSPAYGINQLQVLEPGQGYQLYVSQAADFSLSGRAPCVRRHAACGECNVLHAHRRCL